MQWSALCGFGMLLAGRYFSSLPFSLYPHADFWLNSPALVACKMGVTLLLGSAAFLWTEYFSAGWSAIRLLGTTSLAVYWVHIELVYGRWFSSYKERLTTGECLAATAVLILAMLGMSSAILHVSSRTRKEARGIQRQTSAAA